MFLKGLTHPKETMAQLWQDRKFDLLTPHPPTKATNNITAKAFGNLLDMFFPKTDGVSVRSHQTLLAGESVNTYFHSFVQQMFIGQ